MKRPWPERPQGALLPSALRPPPGTGLQRWILLVLNRQRSHPPQPPPRGRPAARGLSGPAMPEAERRQLTVLVCRLVGLPEVPPPLSTPKRCWRCVPDFHTLCAEVVRRFAGHLGAGPGG